MVASCKLLGFSELAVRLPNALVAVLICFAIFFFSSSLLKSPFKGFLSVLVLITSAGFIRLHVVRSGEYDAFLVLFTTIFCLCYFTILEYGPARKNYRLYWLLFTFAFVCAILTKGIAAMLVTPALFIYTIWQKKLLALLRSKEIYLSAFFIVFFGLGYYFLREHYNHGYLQAVYENELGGRYLKPLFKSSPSAYIEAIVTYQFKYWLPFAFIGVFAGLRSEDAVERRFTIFGTLIVFILLMVLSAGSTRLDWYDAPIFPFLAFISGSGIYFILKQLFSLDENRGWLKTLSVFLLIVLLASPAYISIINFDLSEGEDAWDKDSYNLTHLIESKGRGGANLSGYKVMVDWYMWTALNCHVRKWQDRGQKMEIVTDVRELKPGDNVMISLEPMKSAIDQVYTHETIETFKNVEIWRISGLKKS